MDVIEIDKTNEQFRLVYDTKGRFVVHRISPEEATYKLAKVHSSAPPYCHSSPCFARPLRASSSPGQ